MTIVTYRFFSIAVTDSLISQMLTVIDYFHSIATFSQPLESVYFSESHSMQGFIYANFDCHNHYIVTF